jgi:hypothetical protein
MDAAVTIQDPAGFPRKEDKMNRRLFATGAAALISAAALAMLLCAMSGAQISNFGTVWLKPDEYAKPPISSARAASLDAPTVTQVDPASTPNDLDTPIVITGTGFTAGMTVTLGSTRLPDATWVSSTTLTATVPWGMNPGVYTLTVTNPDGQSGSLPNVFNVTQGIGVWTTGGPYGGGVGEIVINPITPTTLYAKVTPYAVFRSRDGGNTWKPIRIDIGYGPLVMDPLAPDTLYVKGSVCWPVYRTNDGGDTWVALPEIVSGCQAPLIFAHPLISGTIYGVTGAGLWKSEDRGQTWITWTHDLTDSRITGMAFDPTDSLKMYVGTYHGNTFRSVVAMNCVHHQA